MTWACCGGYRRWRNAMIALPLFDWCWSIATAHGAECRRFGMRASLGLGLHRHVITPQAAAAAPAAAGRGW
uniref:Putative secreted protein n=1 Tax=Anopheles darlingi TaxID=43151 RepID=A0A2M4D0A1_ANODA